MLLTRRLISLFSILIIFCAVLPPELVNLAAQDQSVEIEKDSAEKEIDDNDDIDVKFFAPPPRNSQGHIVFFAKTNYATVSSLFFEEVPTPPPLTL